MEISKSTVIISGIVLLCLLVSACLYPKIPERMASHWNAKGQVDGYMPKSAGVFLMPGLFQIATQDRPFEVELRKIQTIL